MRERQMTPCLPKFGFFTGEKYCRFHGRAAGWPCKVSSPPPASRR